MSASSLDTTTRPLSSLAAPTSAPTTWTAAWLVDLSRLTKPRLTVMVLVTVAVGYVAGAHGGSHPLALLTTVLATGLVAGAASAWNQILERDRDSLMNRTANRPLPAERVRPIEAAVFATILLLLGLALLWTTANALAALLAALTFLAYVGLYTPLKTRTTLNTAVGAIPGALPPVIGWAAATGRMGPEAWSLFLILWLWQFPHFLAIAWIYRRDYTRAGYRMLSRYDSDGRASGRQAALHALVLVPVGLLPCLVGLAGPWFALGSTLGGLYYLHRAWRFALEPDDSTARALLGSSFLYLPCVLGFLLFDLLPA